jgi:hypothetical protein
MPRSFRADWLWVDDDAKVTTYINQRGQTTGLIPFWDFVGMTHRVPFPAGTRPQIRFGRVYGTGRADVNYP